MAERAAADLAADIAAHAGLMAELRRQDQEAIAAAAPNSNRHIQPSLITIELLTTNDAAAINAAGPKGLSPLAVACIQGGVDDVNILLKCGADPAAECDVLDTTDEDEVPHKCKEFPLSIAAREGHEEIVEVLLARGSADVNQATSDTGGTALYIACCVGKSNIVQILLRQDGIEVNKAMTDGGATPLSAACHGDHLEVVKMLLVQAGIEVNKARTDDGSTPLVIACAKGHAEVVKTLLAHPGIRVNKATARGATPLLLACHVRCTEIVQLLLARSEIDVNKAIMRTGLTPLQIACNGHYIEVAKLLLAHTDIDVNQGSIDTGFTPLFKASSDLDSGLCTLRMLLADGRADLEHEALHGWGTPMHRAAFQGHYRALQMFAVYGGSLTSLSTDDGYGQTPKQFAMQGSQPTVVAWINAVSTWSQLRIAAGCRLYKDAAFLLRQGRVDPDDLATTSIKEIMDVVTTSKAEPAVLPWRDAPPICKKTIKLVADATRGWHRTTHWLHHARVREAVFGVVVVAGRLEKKNAMALTLASTSGRITVAAGRAAGAEADRLEAEASALLPVLPVEMWFHTLRFVKRSWWNV